MLTSIELCAGAGGQALGVERAGFRHLALVENDRHACATLRFNRPTWNVVQENLAEFSATDYRGVDLVAAGVPCPPFSRAGMQLGHKDERDLFPETLRIIWETKPRAVMFENVRGLLDQRFDDYRSALRSKLLEVGLELRWKLHNASDFGVPQLRPRAVGVALPSRLWETFEWPEPWGGSVTVGEALYDEMSRAGWRGARQWKKIASRIAPTLVGGSKKHGGADLGPTRAKKQWALLGVDAMVLGDEPPGPNFSGMPRLTVAMAATIQGFPPDWGFQGGKTAAYRQVGNAFPPPVAHAVAQRIAAVLSEEAAAETTRHLASSSLLERT